MYNYFCKDTLYHTLTYTTWCVTVTYVSLINHVIHECQDIIPYITGHFVAHDVSLTFCNRFKISLICTMLIFMFVGR